MLRTGAEGDGDNLGCLPASGVATAAAGTANEDLEAELEAVAQWRVFMRICPMQFDYFRTKQYTYSKNILVPVKRPPKVIRF